jgi:glyoxylase-like metal-dependent hydrolase (beta-lactamase superfamily II)
MAIQYKFEAQPVYGIPFRVSDAIYLVRIPIPDSLKYINCYLLDSDNGWYIYDTGMATHEAKALWQSLIDSKQFIFVGIIVSHHHPDHFGLANWLSEILSVPVYMDETEFEVFKSIHDDLQASKPNIEFKKFFSVFDIDSERQLSYYRLMQGINKVHSGTPKNLLSIELCPLINPTDVNKHHISNAKVLDLDEQISAKFTPSSLSNQWQLIKGHGHSPNVCCLLNPSENILLSSDQVLPQISSIVYVSWKQEQINPLKLWLESLKRFKELPDSLLILPSHKDIFTGLHTRIDQLIELHTKRLALVKTYLDTHTRVKIDSFTNTVFGRELTRISDQFLASGEALAHLEYVLAQDGKTLYDYQY